MKTHEFLDIGRIMDEIFEAAEDFRTQLKSSMEYSPRGKGFGLGDIRDFYPAYSFPPSNIFMKADKTLIFEFALAGFSEDDISLEFKGEYMFLTVEGAERLEPTEEVRFFKKRLKFKNVSGQRYYVPEDKFDRDRTRANFKNGMLRIIIPPREEAAGQPSVKIKIEKEAAKSAGGSPTGGAKESRGTDAGGKEAT